MISNISSPDTATGSDIIEPLSVPLPDGTVYSKTKGICPTAAPFSLSPLSAYERIIGAQKTDRLLEAVERVKDLKILELNSTAVGGGVAEMLHSSIPFLNELGVDDEWQVIRGSKPFYETTKAIHNLLQGRGGCFTTDMEKIYFQTLKENGSCDMSARDADIVIIHDPQPLGLVPRCHEKAAKKGKWIWRCHIDMDEETLQANPTLEFFINYWVEPMDATIFSAAQYIICRWPFPKFIIPPFIDPLSPKNRNLPHHEVEKILERYGIDSSIPIICQIGRFDPWKGLDTVIDVFKKVKERTRCQLVIAGGTASDDPEGDTILAMVRKQLGKDPDAHILSLPPTSDIEINALQRASSVILQLSTKEGFGLTVTEALWKSKPVIASPVGGITQQIRDGEYGFFHYNLRDTVENIVYILENPHAAELMGKKGHLYVQEHFLMPDRLADHLKAMDMVLNSSLDPDSIISFHSWHKLDKRK